MAKIQLAYAVPKVSDPEAERYPGNAYHYYRTRAEAEKTRKWLERHGKPTGPVEYRPGECNQLTWD